MSGEILIHYEIRVELEVAALFPIHFGLIFAAQSQEVHGRYEVVWVPSSAQIEK